MAGVLHPHLPERVCTWTFFNLDADVATGADTSDDGEQEKG